MLGPLNLLVTCEHGGNHVPSRYRDLFQGKRDLLETHRGYDIGALECAETLARSLRAPLLTGTVTRLLVDLNRSANSRTLFSEISRRLGRKERQEILRNYYFPFRRAAEEHVLSALSRGKNLLHLSIHSFTPHLHGRERNCDVGLLYDPGRLLEKNFSLLWRNMLRSGGSGFRIRRNFPYHGVSDCLVRDLRRRFPPERYLGLEIEINQEMPLFHPGRFKEVQGLLCETLKRTLSDFAPESRPGGSGAMASDIF